MLQVLKGTFGANKTYWVKRPAAKVAFAVVPILAAVARIKAANAPICPFAQGVVIFLPGDQIEHASAPEIRRLQDPKMQAEIMASKFPECSSVV